MASRNQREKEPDGWLRHPLIVSVIALLIGTVLTSFLVPKITYYRTLQENRLEKALEVLSHNAEVNQRLNALQTTLEIFHKDNSGVAARLVDYKEEQKTLRRTMMERYLEFDRIAWWWYGKVKTEAVVLRLTSPEDTARIDELIKAYDSNLVESTEALNRLWNRFLREEYRPADQGNNAAMADTRRRLIALSKSRQGITDRLAQQLVGIRVR